MTDNYRYRIEWDNALAIPGTGPGVAHCAEWHDALGRASSVASTYGITASVIDTCADIDIETGAISERVVARASAPAPNAPATITRV